MVSNKSFVLWVLDPFFDVEGKGDDFEELSVGEFVVLLEVVEECLLVAQIEVVRKVVVNTLLIITLLL